MNPDSEAEMKSNEYEKTVRQFEWWIIGMQSSILLTVLIHPVLFLSLMILKQLLTLFLAKKLWERAPQGQQGPGWEDEDSLSSWEKRDLAHDRKWSNNPDNWPSQAVGWF